MKIQQVITRLGGIVGVGGTALHPMPESEIAALELEIGIQLPEPYRRFLGMYGASSFRGLSVDNPWIVFRSLTRLPPNISSTGAGLFEAFYGAERDAHDAYSLRVRNRMLKGRIPESIFAIGDDGGAGYICIGISGHENTKVYYWDQSNESLDEEDYLKDYGEPRPPEMLFQNVYLIGESFEDFIERLEIREV